MRALVVAGLLVGCGTAPQPIELSIPGTQVLVTEKLNSGPWKKLSGQFDGELNETSYSIEIADEYELVVVCTRAGALDAGEFVASEVFGTSEDADVTLGSWTPPNCLTNWVGVPDAQRESAIQVMGASDESMNVSMDRLHTVHVELGVPFSIATFAGRHDVLAFNDTQIAIERDLAIDSDTQLAQLPAASLGFSLLMVALDLTADADEMTSIGSAIITKNGTYHYWFGSTAGLLFVPDELLVPGDQRKFIVSEETPTTSRSQHCSNPDDLTDPSVMPRLAPITRHAGSVGVTWTPISDFFTTATIQTFASNAHPSSQSVTASKNWLDRHGKSSLDFDLAVDGYDPAWSSSERVSFELQRASRTSVLSTRTYEDAP